MHYFAYGSNMLAARLRARTPSATFMCIARLHGHTLRFWKHGRDDSGKATIVPSDQPHDQVIGVVYEIDEPECADLDRAEDLNHGYEKVEVRLAGREGDLDALTYRAQPSYIDRSLTPFDWYRDLVIAGAIEHNLPEDYIEQLRQIRTTTDPDPDRAALHRQLIEPNQTKST
ncbi:MAG: gamma-glutamylcyclotransferase [Phycisphaerales bacterium]|nr:MAG: gamma-glutamylcyclotransferase [Phycisphaerales bacterium]